MLNVNIITYQFSDKFHYNLQIYQYLIDDKRGEKLVDEVILSNDLSAEAYAIVEALTQLALSTEVLT